MCHSSVIENEQIEKCIENGMPKKIIKTIKYTIRKRATDEIINNNNKLQEQQQQQEISSNQNSNNNNNIIRQEIKPEHSQAFVSKCPFGHGKFTTPAETFHVSPLTPAPATPKTSVTDNEFDFMMNNNNNNLDKRFSQISQFNTKITATKIATGNNGNEITNLSGHFDDKKIYKDGILAKSTQLTREFGYKMQQATKRLQTSQLYTWLTKTTQPAHLVAIGIVTFVLITVWPELIDGQHSGNQPQKQHTTSVPRQEIPDKNNDMLALIAYLCAFSTHFGAQIWMTFVSGLSLYFSLPRHIFGQCQQILFPKYFAMNAALSITMLIIYMKYFVNTWTLAKCMQLGSLAVTGAIELIIRLYLAPPLLRLMNEKYKIEGTVGSGTEIGTLVQGDLINCPHYQHIHKAFRRIHMIVAIGNVITMAGSCVQLYNIAGQLQFSIVH